MLVRRPLLLIVGTRPEVLKLAPVAHVLKARRHRFALLATGQHPAVTADHLPAVGLRADVDLALHCPDQPLSTLLARVIAGVAEQIAAFRPSLVIVQGDTASALGGALAAFQCGVPVAHVEAGLRTGDLAEPFPEEGYRALIARIATLHFAPTRGAVEQLLAEGIARDSIVLTGNTAIDSLLAARAAIRQPDRSERLARRFPFAAAPAEPLVLATVHRRENLGQRMRSIASGLHRLAADGRVQMALALHPNPAAAGPLRSRLEGLSNVHLLPPLEHEAMVWLMERAALLVTDSGGLQEEAPALGLPTLVLRAATERPEPIAAGTARLVELRACAIAAAARALLAAPRPRPVFPFGDGRAAERIVDALEMRLALPAPARVTRALRLPVPA